MGWKEKKKELYEKLAAIEHERWAHWQKYMHSKGVKTMPDGLFFSNEYIEHWERQIKTSYAQLSEKEKDSDREQVDRYWPLIEDILEAWETVDGLYEKLAAIQKGD